MIRSILFIGSLLMIGLDASAQKDLEADVLLKKISAKYKAYSSSRSDFTMTIDIPEDKKDIVRKGSLQLKGTKFKLELDAMISTCDGKNLWNYIPGDKQIQISYYDKDDGNVSPEKFFSLWEKNYNYRIKESATMNGKACTIVELIPIKKEVSYFKIELAIEKSTNSLLSFVIFDKNGVHTSYVIDKFTANPGIDDKVFNFDPRQYPNVEVLDLR